MPRQLLLGLAVVVAATACSVANPFAPKDTAAQQKQNAEQMRLKWAQCMRDHGIDVPDPVQTNGGSFQTIQGPGPDQQQMQAAMDACKKYAPNGGQGSGQVDQKMLDAATKFAQCMRDHGIPMQDPQATGGGVRIGSGGSGGQPPFDPTSDQFKQAQQACQHYLDQARPKSSGS